MMYVGVRIGSISEACLVLLFLPILRGMAVFRVFGVQFEASVRYHVWIGNLIMLLSLLHGTIVMFIWGVKKSLLKEVSKTTNNKFTILLNFFPFDNLITTCAYGRRTDSKMAIGRAR